MRKQNGKKRIKLVTKKLANKSSNKQANIKQKEPIGKNNTSCRWTELNKTKIISLTELINAPSKTQDSRLFLQSTTNTMQRKKQATRVQRS